MEFYIQMGHGMQKMILELLHDWKQGNVILSPINIDADKIETFTNHVHKNGGEVLFDPQLYLPRERPQKLSDYKYWPQGNVTLLEKGSWDMVIKPLVDLNLRLNTKYVITPAFFDLTIDERWSKMQHQIISSALNYIQSNKIFHTLAISSDVISNSEQIETIISNAEKWNIYGFYIVCQHPNDVYLVDNPIWIRNLLSLVLGLKRTNKKIILGFSNQQMLCVGLAKCDAIASGNFLNTRRFKLDRFEVKDDDEISRRAIWYYAPQTFSEYKVPFLDLAGQQGILSLLQNEGITKNPYSDVLFAADKPSSSTYGETLSHKHYLSSLKIQTENFVKSRFKSTLQNYVDMLQNSKNILTTCNSKSIRCEGRDFLSVLDAQQAAISVHNETLGFVSEKEWNSL